MKIFKSIAILLGTTALISGAYIVKKGDTLWDLSEEFFQDPFTWPDLWEKNRHIADPHWIYPGDSIYLGEQQAADSTVAEPAPQLPPPSPCGATSDTALPNGVKSAGCETDSRENNFENMIGDLRSRSKIQKQKKVENVYYYQKRPQPKIFNAYYQIHSPIVYTLDELKEDSSWFSIISGEKTEPLIHIPETEIVIGIGKNTNQKVKKGDLVEIWDAKKISIPSRTGNSFSEQALLRLAGYAKITAIGDTLSRAIIVQSFREIYIRQAKARLKRDFKPINVNGYKSEKEASFEEMAQVSYAMDPTLVIGAYSYILIDKGIQEGFKPGNAVAIWEKDKSDASIPPRLLGRGVITGADEDNASVLIRELYSNSRRVDLGHSVSVTHRANIVK